MRFFLILTLAVVAFHMPSSTAAVEVCISTAEHTRPVCQDVPVDDGWVDFDIGGYVVRAAISDFEPYYCDGTVSCAGQACSTGWARQYFLRLHDAGIHPPGGWYEASAVLPSNICDCGTLAGATDILEGCGSNSLRVRRFEGHSEPRSVFYCLPDTPEPGSNPDLTLAMHAVLDPFGTCQIDDPCAGEPLVNIPLGSGFTAYLLARNYNGVQAVQTAFDWGDWVLHGGVWDCQVNQLSAIEPSEPNRLTGSIATAFECVTGGDTAVIGRMFFTATTPGCISQIASIFPGGVHALDCNLDVGPIPLSNRGSICVNSGGINACGPLATPVTRSSWGAIKSRYKNP